jgi:hypothetical protein
MKSNIVLYMKELLNINKNFFFNLKSKNNNISVNKKIENIQ